MSLEGVLSEREVAPRLSAARGACDVCNFSKQPMTLDEHWPIVVVTTFFPSSVEPQRTVFVKNLVHAMRASRGVTVISPVPWRPWPFPRRKAFPPRSEVFEGIPVARPRFLTIPGLNGLSSVTYFFGVVRVLSNVRRRRGRFVLHAHCAYPDAVGVAIAARYFGLPSIVTAHGSDINVYATRLTLRPQVTWALRNMSAVIAVSQALLQKVKALTGGAATKMACIPCAGFDPNVFSPRDRGASRIRRGVNVSARVAVFVGQLVPVKQVDRLIEAWGMLGECNSIQPCDRLVIVGEGPERDRLQERVRAAEAGEGVVFTGVLAQSEVAEWLACADLLCLPSRSEGLPNVIVEALASGVPVVASRVGGIPELVVDGLNGYLVPPGDSGALAHGLKNCFDRHWDRDALRASVEHLTWGAIAASNLELIESITAEVERA